MIGVRCSGMLHRTSLCEERADAKPMEQQQQAQQQQASARQSAGQHEHLKARGACLEGKGCSVKQSGGGESDRVRRRAIRRQRAWRCSRLSVQPVARPPEMFAEQHGQGHNVQRGN